VIVLAPRRLPGIRVDVAPPPVAEALPRMDVAVFAGFAAHGPLHVPVLVTSAPQFATVFGGDAPLAWNVAREERVLAHLGDAVRGFFANGGRRCWVIRVARSAAQEAVRQALQPASPPRAVAVANRFPLAGVLEVDAARVATPALVEARSEGSWSDDLRVAAALVQRTVGITDFAVPATDRCMFRALRRIDAGELIELRDGARRVFASVDGVALDGVEAAAPYLVSAHVRAIFETLDTSATLSPAMTGAVSGAGFGPETATLETVAGEGAVAFTVEAASAPRAGAWLRFEAGTELFWLQARSVTRTAASGGSPSGVLTHADLDARGPAWRQLAAVPAGFSVDRVVVATLELRAEDRADAELARLRDVGLTASATNAWWRQSNDDRMFRAALEARPDTLAGPDGQLSRFPFSPVGATPAAWIPLAVNAAFDAGMRPMPQDASALERDGLSQFDASLFLDPELESATTNELLERAETIRFVRDEPRALFGIHAALGIGAGGLFGECSLIAVPDAVHVGWESRPPGDAPPAAPVESPEAPDPGAFLDCSIREIAAPTLLGPGTVNATLPWQLTWTASEPGAEYVLRESRRTDFATARELYRGDLTHFVVESPREGIHYYRVHAEVGALRSAESNTEVVVARQDRWVEIDDDAFAVEGEPGLLRLHRALLRFATAGGELFALLSLPRHYRAAQATRYSSRLRALTAGAGDVDHLAQAEWRVLTHGALHHPWVVRAGDGRVMPPDGAIAGTFAARASRRGAWVAPANEPLEGVVALVPAVEPASWQALQDAAINTIRADARGFLVLAADTLSGEADLRPINVRRLLSLLRRLALRRGTSYVFEPNDATLRRAVERGFSILLEDLRRRGAFAGKTPAECFRVVTDDTVNTRADADAGRLIVELRVAPSVPMRFLSLLLEQSGDRLAVSEEL
jgi:hypothetical protein